METSKAIKPLEKTALTPASEQQPLFVPLPEHIACLGEELLHQPAWANRLLKQLYESTFQNVGLKAKLCDYPGEVWNWEETARFRIKIFNETGFDLTDLHVSLETVSGGSVRFVPEHYDPDKNFETHIIGDVEHGGTRRVTFTLTAVKPGKTDFRIHLESQIGPLREPVKYSGEYFVCDGKRWEKQFHPDFFQTVEVHDRI